MGEGTTIGRRIGVLGGTFDPIHYGHLFIAQEAADLFGLDQVLLVPCGDAPHKDPGEISDAHHRLAMCELAIRDNPHLSISRVEIDRPGRSYAYDTIQHFLTKVGPEDLYFIIGTDAFALIHTWHRYPDILDLCRYVVVRRPGYMAVHDSAHGRARIHQVNVLGVEVSSTDVRKRVMDGRSIKYLAPPAVEQYVLEHGLYEVLSV